MLYIHETWIWISIQVFLSEKIFRHGYSTAMCGRGMLLAKPPAALTPADIV